MHVHWVLPKGPRSEGESMREVGTCTLGVTKGAVV